MCRLLGLLASSPTPATPWLSTNERSLLVQSHVSEEFAQRDGWGIAWYGPNSRIPNLERGIGGAWEPGERDRFQEAANHAVGPVVIGHLRHASNPMNLPRARLIGIENCQPFAHSGVLFAHNGAIPFPRETRPLLGKFETKVQGVNDSEVLFWLLMRHVEELGDPLAAYSKTLEDLHDVWTAQGAPEPGPYSGLNVLFSRGPNELWAFCHWIGEHGPRFLDPTRPYYQMAYRVDAKHAIVGSEPFDAAGDWRSLSDGEYLHAHSSHGLVATRTGAIPRKRPVPPASSPRQVPVR